MAPNLDQWLGKHYTIRDSIIWEYPTPLPGSFSLQRAQPYKNWPERDKGALQTAFDAAWNLRSSEVDDLPANILHPADDHSPTTALSAADAHALYLTSVGQSLAVEIDNRVGWSVADYSMIISRSYSIVANSSSGAARRITDTRSRIKKVDMLCLRRPIPCTDFSGTTI